MYNRFVLKEVEVKIVVFIGLSGLSSVSEIICSKFFFLLPGRLTTVTRVWTRENQPGPHSKTWIKTEGIVVRNLRLLKSGRRRVKNRN